MNIFFLCILFIASCRTDSLTIDANGANQANINPMVHAAPVGSRGPALAESGDAVQDESICDIDDTNSFFEKLTITKSSGSGTIEFPFVLECTNDENPTSFEIYCVENRKIMQKKDSDADFEITKDELERKCDLPNNIAYLKENLIPFRNFNETSITGTGQPKDPFVLKCQNGFTLKLQNFSDRLILIRNTRNAGSWLKSNYYSSIRYISSYSDITIKKLTKTDINDIFNCNDNSRYIQNDISELKTDVTPNRKLSDTSITGTGSPNDPYVLKCVEGHYLPQLHHYNTLQLLYSTTKDMWNLLDFTLDKTNSERSSTVEISSKKDDGKPDKFTCQLEPDGNARLQKCDLTSFQNSKLTTYGMQQIPSSADTKFHVSCVENNEEITVYCRSTNTIVEKNKRGEDSPIDAKEMEKRCEVFTNIVYLKWFFTPGRYLQSNKITGSGKPKDPFVLKCIEGYTLPEMNHYNTIQLLLKDDVWSLLDFTFNKTNSKRSSTVQIGPKLEMVEDRFTCERYVGPNSGPPEELQMCDIGKFDNKKSKTYGMEQIPYQNNVIFYVSCAKNSQEFGISCKDNGKLMDTRYGLTKMEISSEDIEKRCIICPLKDLWQKILPKNMILSLKEAEKYLLQCSVNYAKNADKRDLEAKCSDEGEWEVYQLDTGIKVEFDNVYCEREGCNGYELSGKSSYNESIVMSYNLAVDLNNSGTEETIEFIHIE